ncbi:hypothetical protein HOK51_03810 [Candidatus Woesearchaeota archaeon]|jgi:hypothetical protein|nr:hypothetical protein [Candidatus Woesearchaeota archaeon]MBT6518948.1 hypothetical protein [Candidatus Woesearchaeota archaeon]MBT7368313.1 hypothetical protein [Candidatus Woesearchaeota archaeon]
MSKEFKIDTWWKKALIYFAMLQSGATLLLFIAGILMIPFIGLFEEDTSQSFVTYESAKESCTRACNTYSAESSDLTWTGEKYICNCYDKSEEVIYSYKLAVI